MNPDEGYRGYCQNYRYIEAYDFYKDDPNTARLYNHLWLNANHKSGKWNGMPYKEGQFYTSCQSLAKDLGMTINQVRFSLEKLKHIPLPTGAQKALFNTNINVVIDTKNITQNIKQNITEIPEPKNALIFTSRMPNCLLITVNNYNGKELFRKENGKNSRTYSDTFSDSNSDGNYDTNSNGNSDTLERQYLDSSKKNRASEKQLARENEEENSEDACNTDDGFGGACLDGSTPSQTTKQNGNGNGQSGNDSSSNQKNGNYNGSSNKQDYYVPKSVDEIPWNVKIFVYHITGEKACTTDVWNKPSIMEKFKDDWKGACKFYARVKDCAEHPDKYKDIAVDIKYYEADE